MKHKRTAKRHVNIFSWMLFGTNTLCRGRISFYACYLCDTRIFLNQWLYIAMSYSLLKNSFRSPHLVKRANKVLQAFDSLRLLNVGHVDLCWSAVIWNLVLLSFLYISLCITACTKLNLLITLVMPVSEVTFCKDSWK